MTLETRAILTLFEVGALLALIALGMRRTGLLSICPTVASGDDFVLARTSRLARVLMLGSASRLVLVDCPKKLIRIRSRSFWFRERTRKIPFGFVRQVLIGLDDINPATALGMTGDSFEVYCVGLRLIDDEVVRLFRFMGDGTFSAGWNVPPGFRWTCALHGWTDVSGTQEEDAQAFLDRLARLLNVEIGRF